MTLVLIPGMMCDERLFAPQITALSSCIMIQPASITAHESISLMAENILTQAPPKFSLAGLSMGGIVAMEIIAQAPDRVERLALMDTNPAAETPARHRTRDAQMARIRAQGLDTVMREDIKPAYFADGPHRTMVQDTCLAMALTLGADVFMRQARALQNRPDQTKNLARITPPTLVLCGEYDNLCPPALHKRMTQMIPGAKLEIIPDAGHLTTLEQPEATTTALTRWLAEPI